MAAGRAEHEIPRVVSASREIAADPGTIFELIADPARQPAWDGSDNLSSAAEGQRVRRAGDVFTMTLTKGGVRDNHVTEFTEGRRIAWTPSERGRRPPGHLWRWELEPAGPSRTQVTVTYDWTRLTDTKRLPRARWTTADRLRASLDRLAALAERPSANHALPSALTFWSPGYAEFDGHTLPGRVRSRRPRQRRAGAPATMRAMVSEIFDPKRWRAVEGFSFTDITYHRAVDSGTVRVAFNRPEVRNAFRPHTVDELYTALDHARMSSDIGCVLLTGNGPSPKDGGWAFCSGGDQRIRGRSGYQYASGETSDTVDPARAGRLHILEVQRLIRFMPKVVICVVPGWAAGGGHSLHVVCDMTLASREHARFKQTDADVASFDGGFGSAYLARQVGQKFAREIFFLGDTYDAEAAHRMGMVNAVVPHADLEDTALEWAAKVNGKSPTAQRMLKFAFNLVDDGLVGQQLFAGETTRLAYMTDEAAEGRDAFLEKRPPDWDRFPYYY